MTPSPQTSLRNTNTSEEATAVTSPSPNLLSPVQTPNPTGALPSPNTDETASHSPHLIIPVAGVRSDQLIDTFDAARSEGRVHDAIDIPAPQGTDVLAAADGRIVKLFQSEKGGTTIYELSKDSTMIFYYAHLQRYADGITEGMSVKQGQVIAAVGDTGNAGPGNYHLHFSISVVSDPQRYWDGRNINPYPLLHDAR